jgi:hypothetical protein
VTFTKRVQADEVGFYYAFNTGLRLRLRDGSDGPIAYEVKERAFVNDLGAEVANLRLTIIPIEGRDEREVLVGNEEAELICDHEINTPPFL